MEILDSKINIMKQINMKMLFNLNYKKLKYMYSKKNLFTIHLLVLLVKS